MEQEEWMLRWLVFAILTEFFAVISFIINGKSLAYYGFYNKMMAQVFVNLDLEWRSLSLKLIEYCRVLSFIILSLKDIRS